MGRDYFDPTDCGGVGGGGRAASDTVGGGSGERGRPVRKT